MCVEYGVWSACQHVADNAPTSLSLAHRCVSRRARTARQSQDCLRVRSLSDPRLCVKAAQLAGALSATVGTGATALRGCVSLRHRATAFHPARCIHPRMRLAWLGRDTSRRPATPPRGVCRARAADCALAPLAFAPPLARCRYMPFLARRKRRRLHRLDEPFRCSAQPWRGVMSRFLACANCHIIRGLAHQGAQCAPCQKAERAKDVAWRLGDARNVAAAFHRARPLIANGDHVPTAYSPAR